MKVCVLLLCVCCLCWRTQADPRTFLITAPLSLRLDAVETVLLQLFEYTEEVTVYVFLKTSMSADRSLVQDVVTLNTQNRYQATARLQLRPDQLDKNANHVILHIQSQQGINQHVSIPVSRTNGFLFVQTDKPLYTPRQSVKVRAFSLNQELRPANRSVFLTFKDPDQTTVDIVEMIDVNNGIPSMQNPFKIPIKPKLGIWTIEAAYSNDFTTTAKTDFEVKEYVLPSINILVEPQANYISSGSFNRFGLKITARYVHGAPVDGGEVYLRYGYVSGKNFPVIIPSSISKERLSSQGELDVTVNMENVLSRHEGPRTLNGLVEIGSYLYVAVLLQEATGGISQEAEFAAVKFVKSPYKLTLVSTPPFLKPGLPFIIQVLVKDHLDKPVSRVPVRLAEHLLFKKGTDSEPYTCDPTSTNSQASGIAYFICSTPNDGVRAQLKFETADSSLTDSQATLSLEATSYQSPNARYLYIDPPQPGRGLEVGQFSNVKVYSVTPSYVLVRSLNYVVISRGKVVHYNSQKFLDTSDKKQTVSFEVTGDMVPSIRLLVYYIVHAEGTSELVADSVWLDVRAKCVNGLQTDAVLAAQNYRPAENLQLDVRTNQDGLVALVAVDTALSTVRPNYRDPVAMVQRHLEKSDQGCGGGGGRDNADVFRLAGLTFMTNANAQRSTSTEPCNYIVRPRRALTDKQKMDKAKNYGVVVSCCLQAFKSSPRILTCQQYAMQTYRHKPLCRHAFRECCEFLQQHMDQAERELGRALGKELDDVPTLVRSFFPESWMWEVQPVRSGQLQVIRPLPHSLTTWEIKAVGVFPNGVCAADPVQVSVNLPISVDVPVPYQVVRGEQVELSGSVYNQQLNGIMYCVTLTVGPAICLQQSQPVAGEAELHRTTCTQKLLPAGSVGAVYFTLLGLEAGEHTLTFTLETTGGTKDILQKTLRVVPEGVKKEEFSGGRLDPQGLYGSEKRTVELKNKVPPNIVPNTPVQRLLTINGEVLGDFLSVVHSPEGLRQLINLPAGSAEADLGGLLPLALVYQYLETTRSWDVLGPDIMKNAADLRQKIREGLISVSSFRGEDGSYSMWRQRQPSTWMTAMMVKTLSLVDPVVRVNYQILSESVNWMIRHTQQQDGSFTDTSPFRPNKVMAAGTSAVDKSVYLTSFVLIALHKATKIKEPLLQLKSQYDSMRSAVNYITQHAPAVKSVYVRAVATYAMTLHDSNSRVTSDLFTSLEKLARDKGHPATLRYWQDSSVTAEWVKPDETSGQTVETTAYVLLTVILKGRIPYANPILSWLTQDQHYGEGFYTVQDTILTLEAITEYSKAVPRAVLNQDINVRFGRKGTTTQVSLSQSRPVVRPIQVTDNNDITVSTGYGRGVSNVKMKTVYYQTTASAQNCNFDITVEVAGSASSNTNPSMNAPHLVACAKYKPPPNEFITESSLTVMEIQLPTGVDPVMQDLRQYADSDEPTVSHFELQGNTVIIHMDVVPSDVSLCVGFRVRTGFRVGGATESLLKLYELQDRGNECTKSFSYEQKTQQRLCVDEVCQCMTAACATYRGNIDVTLTQAKRTEETCKPHIKYALKLTVKSSVSEGDFVTYSATVGGVLKKEKEFGTLSSGTNVDLVKKVTCSTVNIQNNKQYLVMGASGSEVADGQYRLPLDSESLVELWPTECSSPECKTYISQLDVFNEDMLFVGC